MYIQGSPIKIQIPKHWNCIRHSITALLPMLLPSSILPPPLSHNAFLQGILGTIYKYIYIYIFFFSSLKFHKWRSVCNGNRSVSIQMWLCWTNTTRWGCVWNEYLTGQTHVNCLITEGSKKESLASC